VVYEYQIPGQTGKFRKFYVRDGINYIHDPEEKELAAQQLREDIDYALAFGFNPFLPQEILCRQITEQESILSLQNEQKKQKPWSIPLAAEKFLEYGRKCGLSEKAFEIFAHDIMNSDYPSSYLHDLDDIVPLFDQDKKQEEIWEEVYEYLKRLMANSKPDILLPMFYSSDIPIEETLDNYLLHLQTCPISIVKDQASILLAQHLVRNDQYLRSILLDEKLNEYASLEIFIALHKLQPAQLTIFVPLIKKLAVSKDFESRTHATAILRTVNEDIPTPTFVALPELYSLYIPDFKKIDFRKQKAPYFTHIDLNNPAEIFWPFRNQIGYLSEISGIPENNLFVRCHSLMKATGNESEWTIQYEKNLRYHLKEIGLDFTFYRPRIEAAAKALMHLLTGLIDSGTIKSENIIRMFTMKDVDVPFFPIIEKPPFIHAIQERDYGGVHEDWVDRIETSERFGGQNLLVYPTGGNIIAEYYLVKSLDWGEATEVYCSQISFHEDIDDSEPYIFGSAFHQLSKDYHYLDDTDGSIITIRDHLYVQSGLKATWIAINPGLARFLGWIPNEDRLFAWNNHKGDLMVESIYWSDGNVHLSPRHDGEVAEGWVVVASEEALKEIRSKGDELYLQKSVLRTYARDGNFEEKQVFSISEI
jgi:hypothetical protein